MTSWELNNKTMKRYSKIDWIVINVASTILYYPGWKTYVFSPMRYCKWMLGLGQELQVEAGKVQVSTCEQYHCTIAASKCTFSNKVHYLLVR